jgi:SAM-dependent methyltransferase
MSTSRPSDPTVAYYEANAERFARETLALDLGPLYGPFLAEVRPGGHILDAGCGPGRDAAAFLRMGYRVTAFDASPEMTRRASAATGLLVQVRRFQDLECRAEYDGIWACAAVLHVPRGEIDDVFAQLAGALRPGGVWYMSFKRGAGEEWRGGRLFNSYTVEGLEGLIRRHPVLSLIRSWETADLRAERAEEVWLNALVRRVVDGGGTASPPMPVTEFVPCEQ